MCQDEIKQQEDERALTEIARRPEIMAGFRCAESPATHAQGVEDARKQD